MNQPPVPDETWSLASPSARRSLLLCALGALLGLAVAGLGLFTAKGTRTSAVPPEDVALVNQVPILMTDYLQQLRALYDVNLGTATPAQKHKVLDDMIREELYVQRGVELGMQADTIEVRTALVQAVEAQSAADATMAQPSEGELQDFRRRNAANYATYGQIDIDDYLLPRGSTGPQVLAAQAALRAGATPPTGVKRSAVTTNGGEFYFAARIHLGDKLFAAATPLKSGEVSQPIDTGDALHLLVVKQNVPPVDQPFADVRDKVLTDYTKSKTDALAADNERFLRKRADVQLAKGYE